MIKGYKVKAGETFIQAMKMENGIHYEVLVQIR
jgi:hypothetical protein